MKIVHFTHIDLDGVGCAAIAQLYANMTHADYEVTYCDYDDINEKVNTFLDSEQKVGVSLLITDISVDKETADHIQTEKAKLPNAFKPMLIDHHKTAEFLNEYDWAKVVIGDTESGTSILAKVMFDDSVHAITSFADAVAEYDTWRFDKNSLGLAKQLNYLCYMMSHEDFIRYVIMTITDHPYAMFEITDPLLLQVIEFKEKQSIEYANAKAEEAKIIQDGQYKVAYVFAENNISMTGHAILDKYGTDIDYAAVIEMDKEVHLRGLEHAPDLGAIAKQRGGGGHPRAAGYSIKNTDVKGILTNETISDDTGSV